MKNEQDKGLTLVEVLLAVGVGIIVSTLLLVIMVNSAGLFYKESSKLQEGLNTNDALARVRASIKESSSVAASYTSGTTTYTSSATQIVLKIPSVDSSGNIIANTFDYTIFFLEQTKFRYKLIPNSQSSRKSQDQIFSTSVDNLTIKYLDSQNPPSEVAPTSAKKIKLALRLKQKNGQDIEQITATSEANLRND